MSEDFLQDDNNDLIIENGDFKVGDAESQHIQDLLLSAKGEWKEHPLVGAELQRELKAREYTRAVREANIQLTADGYHINEIDITDSNITIDAERK